MKTRGDLIVSVH